MATRTWVCKLFAFTSPAGTPSSPCRPTIRRDRALRLSVEALEQRTLLSINTATSVSATGTSLLQGQSVTLTATVTAPTSQPIPGSSDGTVTFYDGATMLGSKTLSGNPATATLTTSSLAPGSHQITASYSGDSSFAASHSGVEAATAPAVIPTQPHAGPADVGVDSAGDLFILDGAATQVLKLPAGGGSPVMIGSGLDGAQGLAVDSSGNVFVADGGNKRVVEFTSTTTKTIGSNLNLPVDVALDTHGNSFIADSLNNQVLKVTPDGTQTTVGTGYFFPESVAVDGQGNVFVADLGNNQIVEVKPDGAQTVFLSGINGSGTGFGFNVAVDSFGDVFVSSIGTDRVLEIRPDGSQIVVGSSFGFNDPAGMAVDSTGDLFIADTHNRQIVEVPAGVNVSVRQVPTAILVSASSSIVNPGEPGNRHTQHNGTDRGLARDYRDIQ